MKKLIVCCKETHRQSVTLTCQMFQLLSEKCFFFKYHSKALSYPLQTAMPLVMNLLCERTGKLLSGLGRFLLLANRHTVPARSPCSSFPSPQIVHISPVSLVMSETDLVSQMHASNTLQRHTDNLFFVWPQSLTALYYYGCWLLILKSMFSGKIIN